MEAFDRTKSTGHRWLLALCAAVGTFLLVYSTDGAWLKAVGAPEFALVALALKAMLTVLLLLIVPSLWARLIWRTTPWTAAALAAFAFGCAWFVGGSAMNAAYPALLCAVPGVGLYVLQRLKLSNFRTVLYASFLALAGLYVRFCLKHMIGAGDAYLAFGRMIDLYGQVLENTGMAELSIGGVTLKEMISAYRMSTETLCVPLLLSAGMCAGLSNTLFSHLWNRGGGAALETLKPFREWRCERWYVIFAAIFSVATMLLALFGLQAANGLSSVSEVMLRMPCSLAGLCAVRRATLRVHRSWIFWCVCGMTVLLPTVAGLLLTLIGILASLRKPLNVGEDGTRK